MNTPQQPAWSAAWTPHQLPAQHQPAIWPNNPAPQQYPGPTAHSQAPQPATTPYPPPFPYRHHGEPIFTVRLRKHTGLALAFVNQNYTVSGTFHQCEAAIKDAQRHNLAAGWWSIASIVLWNWIALAENANARKALRQHASHYGYVPASRNDGR